VAALAERQRPWAAVLGCADSRVPPELLFDAGFGDLFTVRVAGNVAGPEQIGSLEFVVGALDAPLVVVLGHTSCGAVGAAMSGNGHSENLARLVDRIAATLPEGVDIDTAVAANVRQQIRVLVQDSSLIRGYAEQRRVRLIGAVADLATGAVRVIETEAVADG
jgi:carbonic anhydrase